ncbi:MAG TPA: ATP-binding protein [Burkholderiaceae bacterium]
METTPSALGLDEKSPSAATRRAAAIIAALSIAFAVALAPFAKVKLGALPAFAPVIQAALCVNDLITVVLLLGQWRLARRPAVLVLAGGYLFSALMAVLHALSFPGAFAQGGLIGGGAQTTAYLYIFWHAGLAVFALGYAFARRQPRPLAPRPSLRALPWLLTTLALCAALGYIAAAHGDALPPVLAGDVYAAAFNVYRYGQWLLVIGAAGWLWATPQRSVLDVWLAVSLVATACEIALVAIFNAGRWDLGFYAGRLYALMASLSVLTVLLLEQTQLLADLAQARADIRNEAARREGEARFRVMVDAMPQLCWIARGDGWIHWYNRRWYEYTGATPEQMEGWGWQTVHDPAVLPSVVEGWTRAITSGEPFEMVFPLKRADGQFRSFLTRVVPIRDAQGKVVQWFGTNTDISRQADAERALREADVRKDEFLATLSHELRNPLAPIRTAVELMDRFPELSQRARAAVGVLDRQSRHLTRLVDDLLEVSRITQGKFHLSIQRVSLNACVRDALEGARDAAEAAGHTLQTSVPAQELFVEGDATRITQCVLNLLTNAVRFTPAKGRIDLSLAHDGRCAIVSVKDTGVGIAAEHLERIFDQFVQVTPALHRTHGGLGIGLALVKALSQLHGGQVRASSPGPGLGSVFELVLPLADVQSLEAAAEPLAPSGAVRRRRILVVDDNRDAAQLLAELLVQHGHDVQLAHDGRQCLSVVSDFKPEVVFMDIGMPVMNGLEAAQALRHQGVNALLVAVTGWGQEKDRDATGRMGFDVHLTKPIDSAQVLAILQRLDGRAALPVQSAAA